MPGLADTVRLRSSDCRQAASWLPALAAREPGVDDRYRQHLASCLRCQAEVAFYRGMLRQLRALRHDEVPSPSGALAAVLAAVEAAAADEPLGGGGNRVLRLAYLGGIAVATTAAGAAGVLVWIRRRRPALADTA